MHKPKPPLTRKQAAVIEFISIFIKKNGYPPSRGDMADGLKLSLPMIDTYIKVLSKKGHIEKDSSTIPVTIKISCSEFDNKEA